MSSNKRVCLDAGHGGLDSGALGPNGLKESAMTLDVVLRAKEILEQRMDVVLTRHDDTFRSLEERVGICNNLWCDSFVSVHFNSADSQDAEGREIYTTPGQNNSDKLADCIEAQSFRIIPYQRTRLGTEDGDPDKEANFYVIRKTDCPAVLVEGEFIHTERGSEWINNPDNRQKIAEAIACGVMDYHEIDYSDSAKTLVTPVPSVDLHTLPTVKQRLDRLEDSIKRLMDHCNLT